MVKISILGICVVIVGIFLKHGKEEYAFLFGLAGLCLIAGYVILQLKNVFDFVEQLRAEMNIDARYISLLFKMFGICYLTELSCDICKDAGYGALANQIAVAGKLTIFAMGIPVVKLLLESLPW